MAAGGIDNILANHCDDSEQGKKDEKGNAERDLLVLELQKKLLIKDTEDWQQCRNKNSSLKRVAGVDVSFVKNDDQLACAALVVVDFPSLKVIYEDARLVRLTEPYCPGYLAFRELAAFMECFDVLRKKKSHLWPQVVLVDGNGILHPQGVGSACHVGLKLNIPSIGVAKKLYQVDGLEKNQEHVDKIKKLSKSGDMFPLVGNSGKTLGFALRGCKRSSNPVYVSAGHKISAETAVWLVEKCCRYRVPEPVRQADLRSREYIREHVSDRDDCNAP